MMFNLNQGNNGGCAGNGADSELEMLLNEIPQVTYLSHLHQSHHNHLNHLNHQRTSININNNSSCNNIHNTLNPSPFASASFSNVAFGSSSDDDGEVSSPSLTSFDSRHLNRNLNNSNEEMLDQFSLSQTLNRFHISDNDKEYKDFPNRNGFHLFRENEIIARDEFYDYGGFQIHSPVSQRSDDDDFKLATFLRDSCYTQTPRNYLMERAKLQQRGNLNGGIQLNSSPFSSPLSSPFSSPFNDSTSGFKQLHTSPLMNQKHAFQFENSSYDNHPLLLKQSRGMPIPIPSGKIHPSLLSLTNAGDVEAFNCEDSLIIQGNSLKYVVEKGSDRSKIRKKRGEISVQKTFQSTYGSLAEVQGSIYFLAKDQQGCRFLQKIFEEGTSQDVQAIFNEIIDHIVELMMDPFGNYLVQKLLDVSSEEQRTLIVIMVTREPGELVKICLNSHGTRVVQKLISTLKMKQQISLIIMALEPGFIDLIKDVHGNHVVQRCLQCLTKEHTKFIFNAAAKFCVNIATHRHGCCVLNRCIAHSTGKYREQLIAEIAANALVLAQDAFGNYVVQYIIELKIPSAAIPLLSQFEGHYVHLSMQKFSSHVVEKCLRFCEESRSRIVRELLSVPHFDHLLQHPFSNYVIQSALEVTKGRLHSALVEAVQPHMILRSSPYCKKLFSRNLLKKL